MAGTWVDIGGALLAITQIVLDSFISNNGTGFWSQLNWGKFLVNFVSACSCIILLIQHYFIYRAPLPKSKLTQDKVSDGVKDIFIAETDEEGLDEGAQYALQSQREVEFDMRFNPV